jgi:hypothetical protein
MARGPDRSIRQVSVRRGALTDMEGPAVKCFVCGFRIFRSSMLKSDQARVGPDNFLRESARATSGRLRRRIRLICAGSPTGGVEYRMTVVRRELPPSKGASHPHPQIGRRIVSARTLQSCLPGARADAPQEAVVTIPVSPRPRDPCSCPLPRYATWLRLARPVMVAQMKPTSSRATAATATGGRLPCPTRCR